MLSTKGNSSYHRGDEYIINKSKLPSQPAQLFPRSKTISQNPPNALFLIEKGCPWPLHLQPFWGPRSGHPQPIKTLTRSYPNEET